MYGKRSMDSHGYITTDVLPLLENGAFDLRRYCMGTCVSESNILSSWIIVLTKVLPAGKGEPIVRKWVDTS